VVTVGDDDDLLRHRLGRHANVRTQAVQVLTAPGDVVGQPQGIKVEGKP
jgi:hypothetical protein